jgi:hypothetical protein
MPCSNVRISNDFSAYPALFRQSKLGRRVETLTRTQDWWTWWRGGRRRKRQAIYVQRNSVARSWNHCCLGKAISITYFSVCVCELARVSACVCVRVGVGTRARDCAFALVALLIRQAKCILHIVCGFSVSTIFIYIISLTAWFLEK